MVYVDVKWHANRLLNASRAGTTGCMVMNKIRVVWICHFSTQEIQDILRPTVRCSDFAPWIYHLIRLIEAQSDIELHIVAPHANIVMDQHFELRGVHYHFFCASLPLRGISFRGFGHCVNWFNYVFQFYFIRKKIGTLVTSITPDIIHLHGAENAYYSSSILQFKTRWPVLITIQGFISHSTDRSVSSRQRIWYEKRIIQRFNHFGVRTRTMGDDIRKINPKAILHWHRYPIKHTYPIEMAKRFDVVFFARLSKDKGITDLLRALSILRGKKPGIRACIIGVGRIAQLRKQYADLIGNVTWAGSLPTQEDVHHIVSAAKVSVLPTYHDIIPGTIIESMFLKLPVVAYDVGSIHEVNDHEEIITLVKKGDVEGLAKAILNLLNDEGRQKEIAEKGYKRACEMFSNDKIVADLLRAYREVISCFRETSGLAG
jgi:glycosyltransferase involved in cell wall biosynthesis